MALPDNFSEVKQDETGRLYVVHKPSGVIYYVRDEVQRRGKVPPVRVYSPASLHRLPVPAPARQAALPFPERRAYDVRNVLPMCRDPKQTGTLHRARFIRGTEPWRRK